MPNYEVEFALFHREIYALHLTYRTKKLDSGEVNQQLLTEVDRHKAASPGDILATAWFVEGTTEESLPLPDGSLHLFYRKSDGAIMPWHDYIETTKDTEESDDYFAVVETGRTLKGITPEKHWLTISVLFKRPFWSGAIYEGLLKIGRKWTSVEQELNLYAFYGDKQNRISWTQIMDSDAKYMVIKYSPESRSFMRDGIVIEKA